MAGEGSATGSEGVDVRRVDIVGTEGFELGAEIIDADEEDILFRKGAGGQGKQGDEKFHVGETMKQEDRRHWEISILPVERSLCGFFSGIQYLNLAEGDFVRSSRCLIGLFPGCAFVLGKFLPRLEVLAAFAELVDLDAERFFDGAEFIDGELVGGGGFLVGGDDSGMLGTKAGGDKCGFFPSGFLVGFEMFCDGIVGDFYSGSEGEAVLERGVEDGGELVFGFSFLMGEGLGG